MLEYAHLANLITSRDEDFIANRGALILIVLHVNGISE